MTLNFQLNFILLLPQAFPKLGFIPVEIIAVAITLGGGLGGVVLEFLPPTSEAAGSNLGPV